MNDEEAMNNEATNQLIIELAKQNALLNPKMKISNAKAIFQGIQDEREFNIESILSDKKFIEFTEYQAKEMAKHYEKNIDDFHLIVTTILHILLRNYKLFENVEAPKGNLLDYCFIRPTSKRFKKNLIWAMFAKYYNRFEEMNNKKCFELISNTYHQDDLEFYESNKHYADVYDYGVNQKDYRNRLNNDDFNDEDIVDETDGEAANIDEVEELIERIENPGDIDKEYSAWRSELQVINCYSQSIMSRDRRCLLSRS